MIPGRHFLIGRPVTVFVLTLTRIIKSVVTEQAPVTLELRNTPGKKHEQTTPITDWFIPQFYTWYFSGGGMNCVSDVCFIHACTTFALCFFPGVFLYSRVTVVCPVTTDLIVRVNVGTITTTCLCTECTRWDLTHDSDFGRAGTRLLHRGRRQQNRWDDCVRRFRSALFRLYAAVRTHTYTHYMHGGTRRPTTQK